MELKKFKMLQNKLIYELRSHLCLGKDTRTSAKIIYKVGDIIHHYTPLISPIYLIETAVFYLIIPVHLYSIEGPKNLRGKFLKQSITGALLAIIKHAKALRTNQTIAHKLAIIFIQIYKKDHILYKQKLLYLNKILNI